MTAVDIRRPKPPVRGDAFHHGSHRPLLTRVVTAPPAKRCDAIIVPSSRPVGSLTNAVELARTTNSALLVLCSGRSRAGEVAALSRPDAPVTAIDLTGTDGTLPALTTTDLYRSTGFQPPGDIARKRNLGLVVARAAGWERVLFLDDDIEVPYPADLGAVAAVADGFHAVGLDNTGFQDNSVVCHAYRYIGGRQDTFIGGGAMMVRPHMTESFFPEIYNEDWLFLLQRTALGRVASHGAMFQHPFDPFDHPGRAASQEFGDVIAEGIYWLLDNGSPIRHADASYWRAALERRRQLINHINVRMISAPDPQGQRGRILASLHAARQANAAITAELCSRYMRAWHQDRAVWRQYLRGHEPAAGRMPAEAACRDLGIRVNYDLRPADPRRLSALAGSLTVDGCPAISDPLTMEISSPSPGSSGRRSSSGSGLISSAAGTGFS